MSSAEPPSPSSSRRAALVAGAALLALYVATAATAVTFWDAGEFLAAYHSFGIPHPPGTPLLVLLGRAATLALGALGPVLPASLLSAASTAAAGAVTAWLVSRWTGAGRAGVAAAVCAGTMSTVWLGATEAEAYGPALCLSILMLAAAGRPAMLAYLFGLAAPLHVSALVAAPAAVLLAASRADGSIVPWRSVRPAGLVLLAAGAGTASIGAAALGALLVVASLARAAGGERRAALREVGALAIGASGVLVLVLLARHDPPVNQGNPSTWSALADVLARRQYAVAPLFPRQAPWWLQLANVGQWADWQFALGLAPRVEPSAVRAAFTVAYLALGAVGARRLRATSRRGFRATLALFVAGSLGVAAMLNLKAGPSIGVGVLPDDAPHEARERDYFFALAFWTWGAWAGVGAVALASAAAARLTMPSLRRAGVALAALPAVTNWSAVTRRRSPEAELPRALAGALLASVPPGGVLLAVGDNDSYPVWYLQHAEGVRADVTPVTMPLLGATWYRAELARRHRLLAPGAEGRWAGTIETVREIAAAAARDGRALAVSAAVPDSVRAYVGGGWTRVGVAWVRVPGAFGETIDSAASLRVASGVPRAAMRPVRAGGDGVPAWAQALLRCASLDGTCNSK
jgi:hypothetical protein